MSLTKRQVAVVGAGIGGACAALAMARRGAKVVVHEQADIAGEVGAGLQLGPNAVKVLDALGVGAQLRAAATHPAGGFFRDWRQGRLIAELTFGEEAEARYGAPYLQLHRADLLALLMDAARDAGAVLEPGSRISAASELADADIIVAADGIKSSLREAVAGPSAPRFTSQVAWRGLVRADRLPPDLFPSAASVFWGPHRHLVTYPLRNGTLWNVVAVEDRADWAAEDWRATAAPEDVRNAFAGWCAPVETLLAALDETFLWGLFDHPPLPRWQHGNIVLLGDACHAMLPFLAQGAAMAIEDAWVLAACCDALPTDQALPRYQALRKARAERVQAAAAGNGRVYHEARPVIRRLMQAGAGIMARRKGGLLARYDWLYAEDVTRLKP